ncbi:MAG: hypothetical protein RMZ41_024745 [Nostoc sp. DedVER02]|uniref:hypothetical protein n=1 Tax=unclassified Nostoc TaxID=2593658 RepID=UPI002AD262F4|nr:MULTISPECIES: hypothetical protein [unclassified Nostoc]MDZ7986600.1 hypothetical protein [Nostoc sp. DedVER02]MDZ8113987.1 hypothetical protein [Nostoc sp. DedVER01b]
MNSVEILLNLYWLIPHLSLGLSFLQKKRKIIFLYVKTGFVTSHENNFTKTLEKYFTTSNILDCNISYIDIISKLILGKSPSSFAPMYKV